MLSATVIAIAGGVGAAWLLRSDAPDAVHDNAADASAATRQPIAPAPTPPPAVVRPTPEPAAPPPPPTPEDRAEALAASQAETPPPRPAPRRRRAPVVNPRTLRGDRVPSGDRQAAFDEIPW